jgi:hypothetical protein
MGGALRWVGGCVWGGQGAKVCDNGVNSCVQQQAGGADGWFLRCWGCYDTVEGLETVLQDCWTCNPCLQRNTGGALRCV